MNDKNFFFVDNIINDKNYIKKINDKNLMIMN